MTQIDLRPFTATDRDWLVQAHIETYGQGESLSYEDPSFCAKQEPQTSILKCLSVVVVGSFRAWSLRTVSE
jgi:hypothetical protein